MGTKINSLFKTSTITFDDLKNKTLIVDSYNQLYMFLSSIRQSDGGLLKDSQGNATSHLAGLFNRFSRLMNKGIRFVFVFDGKPPELKQKERERRADIKKAAEAKYVEAKEKEDFEAMKKYASMTARLSKQMVEESKELIKALGMPIVQAASEGEAQASYMAHKGEGFAIMSQDADSFLFGAPKVVKNLTITGKRKKAGSYSYSEVLPELISLKENLDELGISREQLIVTAMLTGTDYNIGGIKGIGPKNALKLVKKYRNDFDGLFKETKWKDYFDYRWEEVFELFSKCPVNNDYELKFESVNKEKIREILVEKHEFSRERIDKMLDELSKKSSEDLTKWF